MRGALLSLSRALLHARRPALRAAAMATAQPPPSPAARFEATPAPSRPSFSVLFLGDTMLGRLVDEQLRELQSAGEGPERVWGDLLSLARAADVRLINLECAITDHPVRTVCSFHSISSEPSGFLP